MYVKLGMFFKSEIDAPDFGSISMYFVGPKEQGYVEDGNKKIRKYTLLSTDLNKLNNITNALDGSEALTVDTGNSYILSNNTWSLKSAGLTPADVAEILGNITQIDYQVVNQLPQTGIKGTIYLVSHQTAQGDYYDEYIWTTKVDSSTGENINIYEKIGNTAPIISTMVGATNNANGSAGLAPAPTISEKNLFLKGDGTWSTPYNPVSLSSIYDENIMQYNTIDLDRIWILIYQQLQKIPVSVEKNYEFYYSLGTYGLLNQPQNKNETYRIIYSNNTITTSPQQQIFISIPLESRPSWIIKVRIAESQGFQTVYKYIEEETLFTFDKIYKRQFAVSSYGSPPSGVSATPSKWTQIYPIEDFIPKVTDETGQIPKFKSDGTLESSGFTIESSVPANAVFTDTTYNAATQNTNGLMTAADKTKLDGININNYSMKSDAVVCTEDEYNSLATKTAEFYYIIQED